MTTLCGNITRSYYICFLAQNVFLILSVTTQILKELLNNRICSCLVHIAEKIAKWKKKLHDMKNGQKKADIPHAATSHDEDEATVMKDGVPKAKRMLSSQTK